MSKESKGYVALFDEPLKHEHVEKFVEQWLAVFDSIEQVAPSEIADNATFRIKSREDLIRTDNIQFRITIDANLVWVYLTINRYVIETTGYLHPDNTLPYEVLVDLPGVTEIVDDTNDKRLDQLEAEGLM